jgi:FdhE protein
MDRDMYVDPAADDLATVTLDLLVSEAGFQRHGVNLMLLFGDPDGPDGPDSNPTDGGGG